MMLADGMEYAVAYRRGMPERGKDMGCGVKVRVSQSTLRWFGHMERMHDDSLVKKIYRNKVKENRVRG